MPIYNLLKYSKKNKQTAGSLWNYYRDEPSNPLSNNSESFKYKTSITGNTYNVGDGNYGKIIMMRTNLLKMKLKLLFD